MSAQKGRELPNKAVEDKCKADRRKAAQALEAAKVRQAEKKDLAAASARKRKEAADKQRETDAEAYRVKVFAEQRQQETAVQRAVAALGRTPIAGPSPTCILGDLVTETTSGPVDPVGANVEVRDLPLSGASEETET